MPLFLLLLMVTFISLLSAYLSMKDYQEFPPKGLTYSLFLIRNPSNLNQGLLEDLHKKAVKSGIIFSLEKLLKGSQEALVFYGPKSFLINYSEPLGLLELEDYHLKFKEKDIFSWELISKNVKALKSQPENYSLISDIKKLYPAEEEQIMVQVVFQPVEPKNPHLLFQISLRVAILALDVNRRSDLARSLDEIFNTKTPFRKKNTNKRTSQIYGYFKKRSLVPKEVTSFKLRASQILRILK